MAPHPQRLTVTRRAWPLARPLMTAHGVETTVDIVVAEISDVESRGRGEGVPLRRYGETIDSVVAALDAMKGAVFSGLDRDALQHALPPGAARNALDCAFWDIDAKRAYCSVAELAGLGAVPPLIDCSVSLIEQPLPAEADDALAQLAHPIPLCADESCRTLADLDRLDGKYAVINIKLDKAGGLTKALALAAEAKRRGLRIMVGGVISTSLGIAPALLVAQQAEIIDLDGPLRLALDRGAGLQYDGSTIQPANPQLWGGTWLILEYVSE
jgi:L-alanine-DL-glutamate epimerase-like enolase superfamily enzyme